MKTKFFLSLLLIVFFGLVLRVSYLKFNPPSLNWDEVSHGYNAYSILKTGSDEWGQKLPLINFRAYGDYPLPLNLYLTIPFIFFFGVSEFSIRFPHAILGILTIVSTFYLAWGVSKNKNVGFISALLVAVSPWTLFTSRAVFQSNLSVFLLVTSMAIFVHRERKKSFFLLSLILLFLTLFSYHSTRIFSPLFLAGVVFIFRKEFVTKLAVAFLVIFFAMVAVTFVNPEARARGKWVFLVNESAVNKIIENRTGSKLPETVKRMIYNRPVYFAAEFGKNYLGYFSPRYLFLKGGTQYQFSIPNHGLEYVINLPFFYLGLMLLLIKLRKTKDRNVKLILLWLFLAPIPASITTEKFAVLRSSTMIPLIEIVTAVGFVFFMNWLSRKWKMKNGRWKITFVYATIISISLVGYLYKYFGEYTQKYNWSWQYGYKQVVEYAKGNYDKYDKIIITKKYGEPHEFFLFFWPWDPGKYRNDPVLNRFYQSNWYWVDGFDKFYFVNDWDIPKNKNDFILESKKETVHCTLSANRCLLVTSPDNYPAGWHKIETINFLDGKPAFEIYAN